MEFTNEQIEKAKNCKTLDEFKALALSQGLNFTEEEAEKYFNETRTGELNDDELNAVAGGKGWKVSEWYTYSVRCPFCGVKDNVDVIKYVKSNGDRKREIKPPMCPCGATIDFIDDGSADFIYTKNGEKRKAKWM